ncbi:Mor transcription activator family protein [Bowmanella denitrificans]|uniref:Mor transcription activator family protein n=1 Tax=Bowmanella denitrificans TaxID=366582 RepID=UPI000C99ACE6|nr:Mor transcription activator family protein [Bowmanella denitrificans]
MTEEQQLLFLDDGFDQLLDHLPALASDQQRAMAAYKEHLWTLLLLIERRLAKNGIDSKQAYKLACETIAEIAHYQGGECRYLPRGDKLRQELRDMHMFRLWNQHNWPVARIHKEYCPELNQIQVYKILQHKREEYRAKVQGRLL